MTKDSGLTPRLSPAKARFDAQMLMDKMNSDLTAVQNAHFANKSARRSV